MTQGVSCGCGAPTCRYCNPYHYYPPQPSVIWHTHDYSKLEFLLSEILEELRIIKGQKQ